MCSIYSIFFSMFTVWKRTKVRIISRNDNLDSTPVMENVNTTKVESLQLISNDLQWVVSRLIKGLFWVGTEGGFNIDQVAMSITEVLNKKEKEFLSSLVGPGYITWTGVQKQKILAILDRKSKKVPHIDEIMEKSKMFYE